MIITTATKTSCKMLEDFDCLCFLLHCPEYFRTNLATVFEGKPERSCLTSVIVNSNNDELCPKFLNSNTPGLTTQKTS